MNTLKTTFGLLAVVLAAVLAQAEQPTINCKIDGTNLVVTYTGTLYQSEDAVNWTKVDSASSPYRAAVEGKSLFFCAKGDSEHENFTIPLSDTVNLDMIWIEPGTFIMGSPEDELGRGYDENQHEVTLTHGYWLGKYEVTQAQYEAVMGTNPSRFQGDDQRPVEMVSFYNAIDFCSRLTAIEKAAGRLPEGYEYTLPTEAQWEYACRAGTTTALNNGMDLSDKWNSPEIDELAWCTMNSDSTYPVGLKKPNAWGLYDMHGNLLEWCLDWYDFYPTEPVTDPTGPGRGLYHVIRGGSWNFAPFGCRSAYRSDYNGAYGVYFCGFRVALSVSKNITVPVSETVNLDMVWIEPGTFIMGSPEDELGRWDDETQHQVTLTKGYWMGKYEVTQAQYEAVMGTNPSNWKGADLPVENVSWYDATNFCAKLTEIEKTAGRLPEGYEYTLPTEAQWEYACRAGTRSALNSGMDLSNSEEFPDEYECPEMDEVGWYWYNSGNKTHSVGQKQSNAWGLYDMHGNVFEWCLDWYGDYPASSVTDPTGPATGDYRVIRGGCLNRDADRCRSASRLTHYPDNYFIDRGFRVALAPTPVESKDMTIPLSEDVDLDMIWIDPGTFTMGSPEDELGRRDDEMQHQVTLTSGYWLGQYEVTQAQYQTIMGTNPSYFKGDDLPVEQVSWDDATEFCKKLTEIEKTAGRLPEGYEYTLPTEAQWEYACRAGTTTALNNGKNLSDIEKCPEMDEVGWYLHNNDSKTHPVGQKQPNAWGLYDMHGNVMEWCLDWYGEYPTSSATDPTGASTGSDRVLRGGSWYIRADGCRSASRGYFNPDLNYYDFGFRVALSFCSKESENKDMTIPLSEDVNLDMIWIEPGTFMMGSPEDEQGRYSIETQHQVTLTKGFWLGKYEITQAQYEAVMETNPSWYKGADLPVEQASWYEAMEFCAELTASEKAAGRLPEGYKYTLPTEAQWEYACRAGTTTALNNGKNLSNVIECSEMDEVGWYWYNCDDMTHPVGQKKPNAWGLYDMHGSVLEWCLDRYEEDYPTEPVTDPTGSSADLNFILRGGSWGDAACNCRSACRNYGAPDEVYANVGFRVALVPVQ